MENAKNIRKGEGKNRDFKVCWEIAVLMGSSPVCWAACPQENPVRDLFPLTFWSQSSALRSTGGALTLPGSGAGSTIGTGPRRPSLLFLPQLETTAHKLVLHKCSFPGDQSHSSCFGGLFIFISFFARSVWFEALQTWVKWKLYPAPLKWNGNALPKVLGFSPRRKRGELLILISIPSKLHL